MQNIISSSVINLKEFFKNYFNNQTRILIILISVLIATNSYAYNQDSATETSKSQFDNIIIDLIDKKLADTDITYQIKFNSISKSLQVTNNVSKIKSVNITKLDPQYSTFRVAINYLNKTSDTLSGKYIALTEVPVASRYIKLGEIIQESDLNLAKTKIEKIRKNIITKKSDLIGKKAKRYIAASSMIRSSDVTNPPVIKNHDPVSLVFSSGSINLKTAGVAMGKGAIGDSIKVKNVNSGSVLLGIIIDKNTVRVGGSK